MKLRLPLFGGRYITIFSCYAPTLLASDDDKDQFYEMIDAELQRVPTADKLLLLGDFNAKVGTDHVAWEGVMGCHDIGKMNRI